MCQVIIFKKYSILLSEDLFSFTFKNSVDSDEMQHYAAFHLGIHCLQKYSYRSTRLGVLRIQRLNIYSLPSLSWIVVYRGIYKSHDFSHMAPLVIVYVNYS